MVAAAGLFLVVRTVQFSPRLGARIAAVVIAAILALPAGVFAYRITNPPIDWLAYTPELLTKARKEKKVALVEFTAAWCGNCLALEATVFHDKQVAETIKQRGVVPIRVDLTRDDAPGWELLKQVSAVGAIPLTVIYGPSAAEPEQLPGVYSATALIEALERAK